MSDNEKLTPEYIASIANTLTEEELADLISDYGEQMYSDGAYNAEKSAR